MLNSNRLFAIAIILALISCFAGIASISLAAEGLMRSLYLATPLEILDDGFEW